MKDPRSDSGHSRNNGFTLLEILMAIAIFAIVLSTIFVTYSSTLRVTHIAESQGDIYRKARITMERITEDIASIHMPDAPVSGGQSQTDSGGNLVGEDGQINGHDADTLSFTSKAHLVFSGQQDGFATAVISYMVKEDDKGEGLLLLRSDQPDLRAGERDQGDGLLLCDGLRAVNFTYRDNEATMLENWDTTTSDMQQRKVPASRLPSMIAIRLEFENEAEPEQPLVFMTNVLIPEWQAP